MTEDMENLWSENTKVSLLEAVMTGKIKRKDYLSAIKDNDNEEVTE